MELQKRVELVRSAIERIEGLEAFWKSQEADPASTFGDRLVARGEFHAAEREFRCQWRNVKAILDELVPKVEAETGETE